MHCLNYSCLLLLYIRYARANGVVFRPFGFHILSFRQCRSRFVTNPNNSVGLLFRLGLSSPRFLMSHNICLAKVAFFVLVCAFFAEKAQNV